MSKLMIHGQVLYDNATPASGATVTIRDLDGLDSKEDDRILRQTCDANGRFSGAGNWEDREGNVLGVDLVPDILRLAFRAKADGRTHDGPFLRIDKARSAPIVLPWGPPKPVPKSKRELVQIILVSNGYVGGEKALYEFIEVATEGLTRSILGGSYRNITFVKGANATLEGLIKALTEAARPSGVEAVDLIFSTHGSTDKVVLAEGPMRESVLGEALSDMPEAVRAKLRMCFSTACYGETHTDTWLAAGFTDAAGARGMYADSAVSYAPFLTAWAAERSFREAVAAANAADVGDIADSAARAYYLAQGKPEKAADIDSTRYGRGGGASRIYTTP